MLELGGSGDGKGGGEGDDVRVELRGRAICHGIHVRIKAGVHGFVLLHHRPLAVRGRGSGGGRHLRGEGVVLVDEPLGKGRGRLILGAQAQQVARDLGRDVGSGFPVGEHENKVFRHGGALCAGAGPAKVGNLELNGLVKGIRQGRALGEIGRHGFGRRRVVWWDGTDGAGSADGDEGRRFKDGRRKTTGQEACSWLMAMARLRRQHRQATGPKSATRADISGAHGLGWVENVAESSGEYREIPVVDAARQGRLVAKRRTRGRWRCRIFSRLTWRLGGLEHMKQKTTGSVLEVWLHWPARAKITCR